MRSEMKKTAKKMGVEIIKVETPKKCQYALYSRWFSARYEYVLKFNKRLSLVQVSDNFMVVEDK